MFHHEFFHFLEFACWELAAGVVDDDTWRCLNMADFQYRSSGAAVQHEPVLERYTALQQNEKVPAGFINSYCTSAPEEDRAELFAHMVVRLGDVLALGRTDTVLVSKLRQMMLFLR